MLKNISTFVCYTFVAIQLGIIILNWGERENNCADDLTIGIKVLESSANAARSNNVFDQVIDATTSCILFFFLYGVPPVTLLYYIFKCNTYTLLGNNGLPTWVIPAFRDSLFQWIILTIIIISKNIIEQKRPPAFYDCISDSNSWGMPSGHAAWGAGLALYMVLRKEKSLFYHLHTKVILPGLATDFFIILMWGLAVPFVRYELQYHTLAQILVGMGIGIVVAMIYYTEALDELSLLVCNFFIQIAWLGFGAGLGSSNFGDFLLKNALVWGFLIADYILFIFLPSQQDENIIGPVKEKTNIEENTVLAF